MSESCISSKMSTTYVSVVCPQRAVSNPEIRRRPPFFAVGEKVLNGHLADNGLYQVGAIQAIEAVGAEDSFLL